MADCLHDRHHDPLVVFMLYWIGFLWGRYEVGQSIASLCISSVVFAGLNALAWTLWPARRN